MRLFQFLTWVLASACLLTTASAHSRSRNPLNYLSLLESPRILTPAGRVHAFSSFDVTFDLHRHTQHIRLSLEPNHDILPENAHINVVDKDGNIKSAEKINRMDHKVFLGQAFLVDEKGTSEHVGWARLTVRRDGVDPLFEGAFTVFRDHHHIHMKSNYMRTKHVQDPLLEDSDDEYMVMWRDSDVSQDPRHTELRKREDGLLSCRSDQLEFNKDPNHSVYKMLRRDTGYWGAMSMSNLLGKRQNIDGGGAGNGNSGLTNLRANIGNTAGCPKTRRVALIGVATDCSYTGDFNSTDSVRQNVINQVNTASDLFQSTFNITLGLRNLTVSDAECPGTASQAAPWNIGCNTGTITDRLNQFSAWRGSQPDDNAYWSLWTTCNTGAEVGLAWLGQLCNTGSTSQQDGGGNSQSVTGANVVARTPTEWQVFAHETGHTFGAVHDCDQSACADTNFVNSGQCCPLSSSSCDADARFLMNPFSAGGITDFSPCSVGNICSALGQGSVRSTCLTDNRDVTVITGNQCGNGIVEDGEDCDCGGAEGCRNNPCCNPQTCKFATNAVCDPSNEGCCTTQCQFAGSGTVCRASTGQCDPQEVCPGNNGTCPPDSTASDGDDCGNGLKCASGQCTSRDAQCRTVMGAYTSDNDTYACNSQTCQLSCASPDFGRNTCYSMRQNFLDGTDCGGGGHCDNGVCRGSSVGGQVSSWINDNKTLFIALVSSIGGIIVLLILACCIRACRRRRRPVRKTTSPPMGQRGWNGPAVPAAYQNQGYGPQQQSWGYPSAPAPAYSAPQGYGPRGSVRYA
jgi:hypothetical protein